MHRFRGMTTYWLKIVEKTQTPLIWHHFWGWPLANFSTSHTFPETRVMGLSDGVHFTILLSLGQSQYRRVIDRRTDGRTCRCRKDPCQHSVARVKTICCSMMRCMLYKHNWITVEHAQPELQSSYLCCLASEGIVMLSVTLSRCVCVSAALVSVVKVMRCIQCCLVVFFCMNPPGWPQTWKTWNTRDLFEHGKLRELSGNSVQPQGKIVTNKVFLVCHSNICVKQLLTG